MATIECKNGHIYDPEQFQDCPYCEGRSRVIHFGGDSPAAGRRTVAPEAYREGYAAPAGGMMEPGKTVAPKSYRKPRKTETIYKKRYNLDPVVGWLVCVEGEEKGKSYNLWAKINTIGSSEDMDVCIASDPTITADTHARLAYDPKHNNYQLIPGMSTNNIYLNDEPIYIPVKISAYDLVEFGETKLLFIPLCGDRFKWDEEKRREE